MMGKSEENWANFSIRMSGKKSTATVNCQAFRQGNNWRYHSINSIKVIDLQLKRVNVDEDIVYSFLEIE